MNIIKKIYGLFKMLFCFITNKKVDNNDYKDEYNKASNTYSNWNMRMGKHTDKIIDLKYLSFLSEKIDILDFACGNGYITKRLIEEFDKINFNNFQITGVDIAKSMLPEIAFDNRIRFIESDGIDYLKNCEKESYDIIFMGWALPYFNHNILFRLFNKVLKKNGIIAIIANVKGTLKDIEKIFIETMLEFPEYFTKIMDIRFNLANGKNGLIKWLKKYNFIPLQTGEDEEEFYFDTPIDLYNWLKNSGAIAGTGKIFQNNKEIEKIIIEKIKKRKFFNNKYIINHKFAYGIFKKEDICL